MLALSKWRPPKEVLYLRDKPRSTFEATSTITPRFSIWGKPTKPEIFGIASISESAAIGLGRFEFDPFGYNEDTNLFSIMLRSLKRDNTIDCYHPYWRSNAGENAWLSDRSSPFMQGNLSNDRGVLIFDIPERDPWPVKKNRNYELRGEHNEKVLENCSVSFPSVVDQFAIKGMR